MKKYIVLVLCCVLAQVSFAQSWVKKAQKAVFSVVTYGADGKILNTGNGFFVSSDGVGVSDYDLFKGADHAVVIDEAGKQMNVIEILGANDVYDLVKFRVDADKVEALQPVTNEPSVGATAMLLPYSTKDSRTVTSGAITNVSNLGGHKYYTVSLPVTDKMVSCPVLTSDGQVFGLAQLNMTNKGGVSYAVSVLLATELDISALSLNDATLKNIGIRKALPAKEDQAIAMLYLAQSLEPKNYPTLVDRFIKQFPRSSEGYYRRAAYNIYKYTDADHLAQIESDLKSSEEYATDKASAYSNSAIVIYAYASRGLKPGYKDWTSEKALDLMNKAISIKPQPQYYQEAGDINFNMKKYKEAYDAYTHVNGTPTATAFTYYYAAKAAQVINKDTSTVVALLDSAISKYMPPYPEIVSPMLWDRGAIYFQQQKYDKALSDFDAYEMSVKTTPAPLFYYYREQALYHTNQFARALADINKAVELSPNDLDYLTEQGVVYLRVAKYSDAIRSFSAVVKKDPKSATTYRMLGFCQIENGQKEIGIGNLKKAIELGDKGAQVVLDKYGK